MCSEGLWPGCFSRSVRVLRRGGEEPSERDPTALAPAEHPSPEPPPSEAEPDSLGLGNGRGEQGAPDPRYQPSCCKEAGEQPPALNLGLSGAEPSWGRERQWVGAERGTPGSEQTARIP